ncbi:RyR domain-containing protein [Candidatus Marithrix sp. Canyon 246]|uniref:RyR domain-containing protein n=1 Tax=Candidatus Marithrix sp. Canyon 246 TaxID=1827136 RepID=UPI00084A20EC|nr:RyR domain-containing protein [Candidatus Marithrix sp. Canyon 246]
MQNNNISLLIADPTDKTTLLQAAAHQTERVIFANKNNLLNIQGVNNLRQILQQQPTTTTKYAHIQIDDPNLIESLKEDPQFLKSDQSLKVITFNRHRLTARRLLLSYPLYQYADMRGQDRIRVAIFGFANKAQQMLLQLASSSYYRDFKVPEIIIIDPQAKQRGQQFINRYPGLQDPEICKLNFIDFNIKTQTPDAEFLQTLENQGNSAYGQNLTAILFCLEQDKKNINASLRLRIKTQQTRIALAPIFVEMTQDLPALSIPVEKTPYFEQVVQHFGQLEQTCSWQEIVEASSDKLAKFIHKAYNSRYGKGTKWQDLTETYRDANRGAADHITVKLASLAYWIPEDPSNWSQTVDLTENQELLAKLEHKRWYAERRLNGWQYGTTRDDNRKIHPCLVPYEQLPEDEKQKDRTNIQDLQNFFSSQQPKQGEKVRKAITIALLATKESQLNKEFIKQLLTKHNDYHITFMTALQNPLEQEFAKIAIEEKLKLIIPRPYPNEQKYPEADWIIDLLPAGKQPTSLTTEEREIQHQRAIIYQLERADIVIMAEENQQWIKWRQGEETIPTELSSIPSSLNRTIPSELIMVH